MRISNNIRKIISIFFWSLCGIGIVVLTLAAVNARNHRTCTGYEITITGTDKGQWFINKEDILRSITLNKTVKLQDKPLRSFNLDEIESRLKNEAWIKDAETYFDNKGVLQVRVQEREPVARVFASSGNSFYIDSTGRRLPLSPRMSIRLPVFTGFPSDNKKLLPEDRQLIRNIKKISLYLLTDPFWMAQIAQIDITPRREFEMTPTIGRHIIEFGDAADYEKKFHKLLVFYKQVSANAGMDKYERIRIQYDRQVIGVKKEDNKNTITKNSIPL